MTDRDNLRKAHSEKMSESEEEGEIEDDNSPKNQPMHNQADSSSGSSESEEGDESLDIKPPPAMLKSEISRKVYKTKDRKHDSYRREHHHRRERSSHTDQSLESSRKKKIETDGYSYREREKHKEDARTVKDVREVRLNKDIREHRREGSDTKLSDERRVDNFDVKKMEWREKRLNFIEKKRELNRKQSDSSRRTQGSVSNGKDLRDILREKDRIQREKRLERFRSPPKNIKPIPSSVIVNRKEKELHITPEPTENEEPMEYEDDSDKKNAEDESESDTDNESGSDADSESESNADSKSEASSQSSEEEKEESEKDATADESSDSSSSSDAEEEKAVEDSKPVKSDIPTKLEPVAKLKEIFSTYHPAIQGCRSVDEFNSLTRIEEGTYGVVYRATEKATGKIVALKRLKMEKEKEGFPITSLREINTLLKAQHQNIVSVREIVVGSNIDRIYIVMDFVEHDLRSLMKTMTEPFSIGEVRDLMVQLLRAVAHLHDNWILHRDLKPSNLLLSTNGTLKVGDFGLAREYGSPLKSYTPVVVTLWYRAPELLLGAKKYSTPIDMWSVGCIFGELLTLKPLFPGESEIDQLKKVFKELGTPSEKIWPGFKDLPLVKKLGFANYPYNRLKHSLPPKLTDAGFDLINRLLTYNPAKRITAEKALSHDFIEKNIELQKEVDGKSAIAGAVARLNFVGASVENQSDQSLKGGGGFTLKF